MGESDTPREQESTIFGRLTGTEFIGTGGKHYLGSEYRARFQNQLNKLRGKDIVTGSLDNDGHFQAQAERTLDNSEKAIEKAKQMVDNLHEQAARNLGVRQSERYPGVSEAQTEMSVLDLIVETCDDPKIKALAENAKKSQQLKEEDWILSSSTPAGGADGGPYTALDMALDVSLRKVPEIIRRLQAGENVDMKCLLLGSPIAVGDVTSAWVDRVKEVNIFNAQAELHAELLNPRLESENVSRVVMMGHSFGAVEAELTADRLGDSIKSKTTILADSPAPTGADPEVMGKVMQEGMKVMSQRLSDLAAKGFITGSIERQLVRNGVSLDSSAGQKALKKELYAVVLGQVKLGPAETGESLYAKGVKRNYVRVGVDDSLTFSKAREEEMQARKDNFAEIVAKEQDTGEASARFLNQPVDGGERRTDVSVQPLEAGHPLNRIRERDAERIVRIAADFLRRQ